MKRKYQFQKQRIGTLYNLLVVVLIVTKSINTCLLFTHKTSSYCQMFVQILLSIVIVIVIVTKTGNCSTSSTNSAICTSLGIDTDTIRTTCEQLQDNGDHEQVIKILKQLEDKSTTKNLLLDKKLPSFYNILGVSYYELNKLSEASKAFELAVKYYKTELRSWINVSLMRQIFPNTGSAAEAIKQIELLSGNKAIFLASNSIDWKDYEISSYELIAQLENKLDNCADSLSMATNSGDSGDSANSCEEIIDTNKGLALPLYQLDGNKLRKVLELLTEDSFPLMPAISSRRPINNQINSNKTLRIGWLLSEIGSGPVASLTQKIFTFADYTNVEFIYFSLSNLENLNHEWRKSMRTSFSKVVYLDEISAKASAEIIAEKDIDILIDVNGLSFHSGLAIMSYRPSSIQISFLGDPFTSAAKFVDYFISDAVATPPEIAVHHFTEHLALIPTSYLVNSHKYYTTSTMLVNRLKKDSVGSLLQQYDGTKYITAIVSDKNFIFGAFQGYSKVDPVIFQSWVNILRRCGPHCMLLIDGQMVAKNNVSNKKVRGNILQQFSMYGLSYSQVLFLSYSNGNEHLRYKSIVDIYLDTIVKNGHTTSIDATWIGIPMITLGHTSSMRSRAGESISKALYNNYYIHSSNYNIVTSDFTSGDNDTKGSKSTHINSYYNNYNAYYRYGIVYSLKEYENLAVWLSSTSKGMQRLAAWRKYIEKIRYTSKLFSTEFFTNRFVRNLQAIFDLNVLLEKKNHDRVTGSQGNNVNIKKFHVFTV